MLYLEDVDEVFNREDVPQDEVERRAQAMSATT
jgi:hypothetical protein